MTKFLVPPSNMFVPTFSPTFDGEPYTCKLCWNLSSQRYFVLCLDFDGNLIFFVPLIWSPVGIQLLSLTWDSYRQVVNGECSVPHNIPVGASGVRTIQESSPDSYNGTFSILSTGATTFSYPMLVNPNIRDVMSALVSGSFNHFISMTGGYFESVLIYRNGQFEVYP